MSKTSVVTIGVITIIILIAGWYTFTVLQNEQREGTDIFKALSVPEEVASYTDLEGNPISLTDYEGKILVINSWASWCPFCTNELPDFGSLATEYKDKDVVVLAINREESKEQAERFLRTVNSGGDIIYVLDPSDYFYNSIGGFAMPETIFYDKAGNSVFHKRGYMRQSEMRQHIEEIIVSEND